MIASKKKLKQSAGLLNDAAPENHILAYITPQERDMLVDAGGVKTSTPSGIFAYPPLGQAGTSPGTTTSGGSAFSGGGGGGGNNRDTGSDYGQFDRAVSQAANNPSPTPSGGNNDNNYQDRIQRIASGTEPGFRPQDDRPFGLSKEEAYRQGRITKDQYEAPAVLESQFVDERSPFKRGVDNVLDFFKSGGILGNVLGGMSSFSEGLQQKAMTFSLNKRLSDIYEDNPDFEDYESLDEIPGDIGAKVRDLENDLQGVRDGTFKQSDFTAKYGSGDATNPLDASFNPDLLSDRDQRNLQNLFTPELAYAVSGQTPQDSMVNQYFNNMNMNQGSPLSSNLQTDYNNAKNSINSILGVLPPSQQFGYSADPYGGLMASNLTTNPFNIDYLRRLGLI
jgi:hypothetical protein